jgi:hypothetical protein
MTQTLPRALLSLANIVRIQAHGAPHVYAMP